MRGDHLQGVLEVVLVPRPCDVPAPELWREMKEAGDDGGGTETWLQVLLLQLTCCVTLGQPSDLSEP